MANEIQCTDEVVRVGGARRKRTVHTSHAKNTKPHHAQKQRDEPFGPPRRVNIFQPRDRISESFAALRAFSASSCGTCRVSP